MAPRETRIETHRPPLISKAAAERLVATPKSSSPTERRSGEKRPLPAGVQAAETVESPASMAKVTPVEQAEVMKEASRLGVPFCEPCASAPT